MNDETFENVDIEYLETPKEKQADQEEELKTGENKTK